MIRFNCTQLHCTLGGVTISGVGMTDQAVQVVHGQLGGYGGGVTLLSSESAVDVAVNATGHLLGGTVGRSAGGLTIVGHKPASSGVQNHHAALELGAHSSAALAVSAAGDSAARLGVSTIGHISWGDGGVHADRMLPTATLGIVRTAAVEWDPPVLEPNGVASVNVTVDGSQPGDVATTSLAQLGFADAQLTAAVAMPGIVKVIFRNVGASSVDVPFG
eukprot:SAG31_NODE_6062_length_2187_cov_1.309387_3_plen_217_part_01